MSDISWFHDLCSDNAWFSDDSVNNFSYSQYCCDICFLISVHDSVWVYLILHLQFFIMTFFCFQSIFRLCCCNQFISSMILCSDIFISLNIICFWWLAMFMFVFFVFFIILAISFCFAFLMINDCFHFFSFISKLFHNCEFI